MDQDSPRLDFLWYSTPQNPKFYLLDPFIKIKKKSFIFSEKIGKKKSH